MIDLSELYEFRTLSPDKWNTQPRQADIDAITASITNRAITFVTGFSGTGKTATIRAAIDCAKAAGDFQQVLTVLEGESDGDLDRALRASTPFERILIALDQPEALSPETAEMLNQKVFSGACAVVIECFDRKLLDSQFQELERDREAAQIEILPLTDVETYERLTQYFNGAVVAESAFLLWFVTSGNPRMIEHWLPSMITTGAFRKGNYAWYWEGNTAPTPPLTSYVTQQFESLDEEQQRFLEFLVLAESLSRAVVADLISDQSLFDLQCRGIVTNSTDASGNTRVVLKAVIWGDVLRPAILPGRRSEIFKQLAQPSTHARDNVAVLAWTLAAIEDGYPLTSIDLLNAAQSAYLHKRIDHLEIFVNQQFPPTSTREAQVQSVADFDSPELTVAVQLLIIRAMGLHQKGQHQTALYDIHTARAVLDVSPPELRVLYASLALVEGSILRGMPTGQHKVKDLYDIEISRALSNGDQATAHLLQLQALSLPVHGEDLQAHVDTLNQIFSEEEAYSSVAITILPEAIYLNALSGRIDAAIAMADTALKSRSLKNALDVEHAFPWVYAEIVSARFTAASWKGDTEAGLSMLDPASIVHLVDSAVYQMGTGRALAHFGQWEAAAYQFLGSLERFDHSDPLGRKKYAFAGHIQAQAAIGNKSVVAGLLKEYDAIEYLTVGILASDADYVALTGAFAAGTEDLHARIDAGVLDAQRNGLWFSALRFAHIGVVASTGSLQKRYLGHLEEAAANVDDVVAARFLNDGRAAVEGSATQLMQTRAELTAMGVWIPQREIGVKLTRRQKEIVELVSRGYTNRDIAAKLVLSVRTVDAHVSSILARTGASDRKDLAAKLRTFL